ncbi:MAG: N-6 DNA methylase [Spirochaetaceae bacterium]|nr:N-6 DNA methylase [Spirochaetaceae bacterium]
MEKCIADRKTLAKTFASLSFCYSVCLREYIADKRNRGQSFYTKFNGLFGECRKSIHYHYGLADFCDIYSQSFVYALLLARLDTGASFSEADTDFLRFIPVEYTLLHEFLSSGYESRDVPSGVRTALANIGKTINLVKASAIKAETDTPSIAVYLYEDFLSEYDALRGTENRKEGGVYYTPREAADFIVLCVQDILKTKFNLPLGFAARNVKTLDFACGTGAFLHSILERILPEDGDELALTAAKEKILQDLYGFEVLFTPYLIAHTLLARFLASRGVPLGRNERIGVYLTNTLDIAQHSVSALLPSLKRERGKASRIKDGEAVLAIVGNPPYFGGTSRADTVLIDAEVQKYKDGLQETNIKPLNDMYIKFIRFAEWKIETSGEGVMGIVANNSFLDGLIHRSMRKHLYETFDELYILNLHGNSQKREGDKNIFDIRIGVAILLFVKYKRPLAKKSVYYYSTLENTLISRKQKLAFLERNTLASVRWEEIEPAAPNFWFVKKDFTQAEAYKKFVKITDIFEAYVSGIKTSRDAFCIRYSLEELNELRKELLSQEVHILREKYRLQDGRDWTLKGAIDDIENSYNPMMIHYRPFDYRWTSMSKTGRRFLERPRYSVMRHFENRENVGICFLRQFTLQKPYTGVLISQYPVDIIINNIYQGSAFFAPLYVYADALSDNGKHPNWTALFQKNYLSSIDWKPEPEEVFAYIYAVLSSPAYREKYREFLKTDFPGLPLTRSKAVFKKYAGIGKKLTDLHLFKTIPEDASVRVSLGDVTGAFVIEKITFSDDTLSLEVRNTALRKSALSISGVGVSVYDFEIGSRKPVWLWLKNRVKDKVYIGLDAIQHLKNMIIVIKETIAVMAELSALHEEYLNGL